MGFEMNIGDNHYDFEPDNCVINLFRNNPDMDYVAYHLGDERYSAIFDPAVCHWLGGVALSDRDKRELKNSERNLGTYAERFGGNPRVIIDDEPDESEIDLRVRSLSSDLDEELKELNGEI